jgi:hypothetical protein
MHALLILEIFATGCILKFKFTFHWCRQKYFRQSKSFISIVYWYANKFFKNYNIIYINKQGKMELKKGFKLH